MRRIFIIRKDLHLTPGKLAAMVGHCCEAYWTNLLKSGTVEDLEYVTLPVEIPGNPDYWMLYRNLEVYMAARAAHERGEKTFLYRAEHPESKYLISTKIDKSVWDEYVNGIYTKTICESRNLNHLLKAKAIADELGLKENEDYGFINDKCLTELKPENEDGTTTVGMWFAPLADEVAHKISRKYPLYRDHISVECPDKVTGHFNLTKEENSQRTEAERMRRFQEICKQSEGGLQTFKGGK